MHVDELNIDVSLVVRLLSAQFPQWADLPIKPVHSAGTDNAIFRLGDDMAVRLPRIQNATLQVDKEHLWLPNLAPHLPLAIPFPLAKGTPGENATIKHITDPGQAARELAHFIAALQRIDPADGPTPGPHNSFRSETLKPAPQSPP